jgi:hypothetical protein
MASSISASFSEMTVDRGVEPALLLSVGDQPPRSGERAMHIGSRSGAGREIFLRASEEVAALRRLRIGQPGENGVQRLGDIARAGDSVARRAQAR